MNVAGEGSISLCGCCGWPASCRCPVPAPLFGAALAGRAPARARRELPPETVPWLRNGADDRLPAPDRGGRLPAALDRRCGARTSSRSCAGGASCPARLPPPEGCQRRGAERRAAGGHVTHDDRHAAQRERARRLRLDMDADARARRTAAEPRRRRAAVRARGGARARSTSWRCCARPPGGRRAAGGDRARGGNAAAAPRATSPSARRGGCAASTRRTSGATTRSSSRSSIPLFEFMYRTGGGSTAVGRRPTCPSHGRALLVANHAGVLPWDAAMMSVAIRKHHPLPRHPRVHGARLGLPAALGERLHAPRRRRGRLSLQRDAAARAGPSGDGLPGGLEGSGQAVLASATGCSASAAAASSRSRCAPARRSCRSRSSARRRSIRSSATRALLARLIGAPYFPITPTFPLLGPVGAVPLPSTWRIEFCEPIDLSGVRPGRRRGPRARVRAVRAGARHDPGEVVREPGRNAARRFLYKAQRAPGTLCFAAAASCG